MIDSWCVRKSEIQLTRSAFSRKMGRGKKKQSVSSNTCISSIKLVLLKFAFAFPSSTFVLRAHGLN